MKTKFWLIFSIALISASLYLMFFVTIDTREEIECMNELADELCAGLLGEIDIVIDAPYDSTYFCSGKEFFFQKYKIDECLGDNQT